MALYDPEGRRKYLTRSERERIFVQLDTLPEERALFVLTLAWSGARISEVLALTAASFDLDGGKVAIRTLKRRRPIMREVPLPSDLLRALDRRLALRRRQRSNNEADLRLWCFSRVTGWRLIKRLMEGGAIRGKQACARGFRHGLGVGAVEAQVAITVLQRWMGHARLTTTSIYTQVAGPEERALAQRLWQGARTGLRRAEEASHAAPPA